MANLVISRAALACVVLASTISLASANSLGECGDIADPILAQRAACDAASAEAAIHANLAMIFLESGRIADALAASRRAVTFSPEHQGAQISLVATLAAAGSMDEAMAAYKEAQAAGSEASLNRIDDRAWDLTQASENEAARLILKE